MSNLMLHAGGTTVTRSELATIKTPDATKSWFPVTHIAVLEATETALAAGNWAIRKASYGVAYEGRRFFGVLDLESKVAEGVSLSVGVRNSNDKSFPLGFAAGSRVFVCDNLAFSAELLIRRRHTTNGERDFKNRIATAVDRLTQFREDEAARVKRMCLAEITDDQALAFMLRSFERGVLTNPRDVTKTLAEWRKPSFDYGTGDRMNVWRLFNSFTTVMKPRRISNPAVHAASTIRLSGMVETLCGELNDGPRIVETQTVATETPIVA